MKKKIVIAGMIFSLLVPMGVNAQNVGNVTHVNGVMYPVASGISSYDSGKDLADDLFRRICGYEDGEDSEDLDISDSNEYSSLDERSIENDEDKKVIDYFNEGLKHTDTFELYDYTFPVLDPVRNGLMLLIHTAGHLQNGIGIRHLLDWGIYADRYLTDAFFYY